MVIRAWQSVYGVHGLEYLEYGESASPCPVSVVFSNNAHGMLTIGHFCQYLG
jgi:hypothetical protein